MACGGREPWTLAYHRISEQPWDEEQVKVAGYKVVSPSGKVPMESTGYVSLHTLASVQPVVYPCPTYVRGRVSYNFRHCPIPDLQVQL